MYLNSFSNFRSALVACECPHERERLVGLMKRLGFASVFPVACGGSMLGTLRGIAFDLIVTEPGLAGGSVFELVDIISDAEARTHIIVCGVTDPRFKAAISGYARGRNQPALSFGGDFLSLSVLASLIAANAPGNDAGFIAASMRATREELEEAFDEGEILPYFQSQHCLSTGRLVGAELLARWQHPGAGILPPAHFLPLVERWKLEERLVDTIIAGASALRQQVEEWPHDFKFSFNVSARIANSAGWAQSIVERLRAEDLLGRSVIEILEDGTSQTNELLGGAVGQWRLNGIDCAMDDFGKGFSSFSRLESAPFNIVKIDKEMIWHARTDQAARRLLESAVTVARELEIAVVAEGLETAADVHLARSAGCNTGQGYAFSMPMCGDEFVLSSGLSRKQVEVPEAAVDAGSQ